MNSTPTSSPTPLSPTIKIIQLNCNKKGSTVHGLLNTCFNDADLLLLQEPWWAQISPNGTKGPVGHRAWTPILPTTTQSIDDPPTMRHGVLPTLSRHGGGAPLRSHSRPGHSNLKHNPPR